MSGVNQTTPFANGTFHFIVGGYGDTVTITSVTNDLTFSVTSSGASALTAPTQSQRYATSNQQDGLGQTAAGASPNVTHGITSSNYTTIMSGADVQKAAIAVVRHRAQVIQ
jgi:hypothetical protein